MSSTVTARPRIAVIAVHGVADQKPSDTARTAAKMLARAAELAKRPAMLERAATIQPHAPSIESLSHCGTYSAFEERSLRIPVTRTPTPKAEQGATQSNAPVQSRLSEAFAYKVQSRTVTDRLSSKQAIDNSDMSLSYMTELLEPYQVSGTDAVYETLRLESTRTGSKADVDVYELYWADLSRLVGNWMRWLAEFYQLLFDLCILGRKSLGFARAQCEPRGKADNNPWWRAWPVFANSQLIAQSALALFVPLLNLYLLGIALSILPLLIRIESVPTAVSWLVALAAALASGFAIYFRRTYLSRTGRAWPWLVLIPLTLVATGACPWFEAIVKEAPYAWLMIAWWLLPLITILWAMSAYQKHRPGALPTAIILGVPITAAYVYFIGRQHGSDSGVIVALLHTGECVIVGLFLAWVSLYASALVMTVSGAAAPSSVPESDDRDSARRAAWTANLTVVLPGMLVLILTLTLWYTLISLATPPKGSPSTAPSLLGRLQNSHLWQTQYTPCGGNTLCKTLIYAKPVSTDTGTVTVADAVDSLFRQSQTPAYCIDLLLFTLALGLVVWTIIPAAVAELQARRTTGSPGARTDASSWLGENLSAGFRAMRFSGEIVRLEFILIVPVGALLFALYEPKLHEVGNFLSSLNALTFLLSAWLAVALIAAKGPFRPLALGLRSALDVALDVINWLRMYPRTSNCRARVCARFYSLLQHLQSWRPREDGQGYCAIVILSHSQGTVITADLLRYLHSIGSSPTLPVYFFTMGCPLRQLYGLRFPNLYGWARISTDTWPSAGPNPASLGVARWVNAYTSGDYVGRYLWHPDLVTSSDNRWSVHPTAQGQSTKREFCIGAGAHTHYWDDSAPEIAIELDHLIGLAAASSDPCLAQTQATGTTPEMGRKGVTATESTASLN